MSENCVHKPDVNCGTFLRRYFQKDGILMQTFRCRVCGADIRFVKKPVYRLLDVLIWIVLLAFMLLARLFRGSATASMSLWLYILLAVVAVSLLGLLLDMTKEWFLLKRGSFEIIKPEPAAEEPSKEDGPKEDGSKDEGPKDAKE
jgi:uncharacterized protein (DUF983 family)